MTVNRGPLEVCDICGNPTRWVYKTSGGIQWCLGCLDRAVKRIGKEPPPPSDGETVKR